MSRGQSLSRCARDRGANPGGGLARRHPRVPVRPRRRAHEDGEGPRGRVEGDVRHVPARALEANGRGVRPVRLARTTTTATSTASRATTACASFLASRGIELPEGDPSDPPGAETVSGLGNRKNELVLEMIREQGVEAYEGSVDYVHAARDAGLRARGRLVERELQGRARRRGHRRPLRRGRRRDRRARAEPAGQARAGHVRLAARALGVEPAQAAVFEDALAGVAAGRAGNFGFVVGVDRVGQARRARASTAPTSSSTTSPSCCAR